MSPSCRRANVALIASLLGRSLPGQGPPDSIKQQSVIDAATAVRERGARSVTDILTSRVPGLLVVPASGVNGMGARIRLRGVQSLVADRAPLVLVDGMRVEAAEDAFSPTSTLNNYVLYSYQGPLPPGPLRLDDLNPDDIESIDVLPGAASGAIYGPGAEAGVILIHTKRGRAGPPRWEGYVEGGVSAATTHWPANFGGVDSDNPDPRYQHGACSLWNEANGFCRQDFVQQFNPLEQRSPYCRRRAARVGRDHVGRLSRVRDVRRGCRPVLLERHVTRPQLLPSLERPPERSPAPLAHPRARAERRPLVGRASPPTGPASTGCRRAERQRRLRLESDISTAEHADSWAVDDDDRGALDPAVVDCISRACRVRCGRPERHRAVALRGQHALALGVVEPRRAVVTAPDPGAVGRRDRGPFRVGVFDDHVRCATTARQPAAGMVQANRSGNRVRRRIRPGRQPVALGQFIRLLHRRTARAGPQGGRERGGAPRPLQRAAARRNLR